MLFLFYHKCIWDFLCCCHSFYPCLNRFSTFLLSYVAVHSNMASTMSHGYNRPGEVGVAGKGGGGALSWLESKTSLYTCTLVKHHVTNYMSQHMNKEFQFRKGLSIKHWSNLLVSPPGHFFWETLYSCIKLADRKYIWSFSVFSSYCLCFSFKGSS